jgi:hypothetical protein
LHKQNTHEGVVWPCNICPYKAARPVSLKFHIKSFHNIELPKERKETIYSCDECTWKTKRKITLEMHNQSKHDGVVCPCDTCPYKATNRDNLRRHKKFAHGVDSKVKMQNKLSRCKKCSDCKAASCGSCAKCLKFKRFGGSGKSQGPCLYLRTFTIPTCKQFELNEVNETVRIKTEQLSECKEEFSNDYEFKLEQDMS